MNKRITLLLFLILLGVASASVYRVTEDGVKIKQLQAIVDANQNVHDEAMQDCNRILQSDRVMTWMNGCISGVYNLCQGHEGCTVKLERMACNLDTE